MKRIFYSSIALRFVPFFFLAFSVVSVLCLPAWPGYTNRIDPNEKNLPAIVRRPRQTQFGDRRPKLTKTKTVYLPRPTQQPPVKDKSKSPSRVSNGIMPYDSQDFFDPSDEKKPQEVLVVDDSSTASETETSVSKVLETQIPTTTPELAPSTVTKVDQQSIVYSSSSSTTINDASLPTENDQESSVDSSSIASTATSTTEETEYVEKPRRDPFTNLIVSCPLLGNQFEKYLGLHFVSHSLQDGGTCRLMPQEKDSTRAFDLLFKADSDEMSLAFRASDLKWLSRKSPQNIHSLLMTIGQEYFTLTCRNGKSLRIGEDTVISQGMHFGCEDYDVQIDDSGRNANRRFMILDVKITRNNGAEQIYDGILEIYKMPNNVTGIRVSQEREIYDSRSDVVAIYNDVGIIYMRKNEPGATDFSLSMMISSD